MKKKKNTPNKSSKNRDRSPQSGDDIISARDKFKGALQELLPPSDDETDPSDEDLWASKSKRMAIAKKRQPVAEKPPEQDSNKYVMKLYDRSVDLAQFNENTPLYPICRAWIANQPHLLYNIKKEDFIKEEIKDEPEFKLPQSSNDLDAVCDTYKMPAPDARSRPQSTRIPPVVPYQTEFPDISKESTEPPSKEALLSDNIEHWRKVRRNWMEASSRNEARYSKSITLLSAMYNKAQKQFQNT